MSTSGSRLRVGAATLIALALTTGVLAGPAGATTSPLGIGVARLDDMHRDTFSVPVWSDAGSLTSVTAVLTAAGGDPVTVPLTDADAGGLWTPAAPLTLGAGADQLPVYGQYAISVHATDDAGDDVTRDDTGTLDFTVRPVFQQCTNQYGTAADACTVMQAGYAHPAAAITGTVVGVVPGSDTPVPLAAQQVTVSRQLDANTGDLAPMTLDATTGADGRFTTAEFPQPRSVAYSVQVTGSGDAHGTITSTVFSPVAQTDATVTATANHTRVEVGQALVISGKVYRGPSTSSARAGGVRVDIDLSGYQTLLSATVVTTKADGSFSGTVYGVSQYNQQSVTWSAFVDDPFLTGSYSGTVVIPVEGAYSGVSVAIADNGLVTARGTLAAKYNDAVYLDAQRTYLQYSPDGKTGWKSLGSTAPSTTAFTVSAYGYVDGYYRVVHAVSDQLGAVSTTAVRRYRTRTDIFANNATPEPVTKGHTVTVTGTLKDYRSGAWHAMAHRPVYLFFQAKGSKSFSQVAAGSTDAKGVARLHATATKDGYWTLQYYGDSTHFNSGESSDYVDVR